MSHFWQNHSWNHSLFECLLFDFLLQIYRRWSCFQYQTAVIAWSMSCFASHHEISMTSWNLLQHIWHWCHGVTSEISSTTNMPWIAIVKETSWVQLLQHQKSWTSIIKKTRLPKNPYWENESEWFMMFPNQAKNTMGLSENWISLQWLIIMFSRNMAIYSGFLHFWTSPQPGCIATIMNHPIDKCDKRWLVGYYIFSKQPWNIRKSWNCLRLSN